MNTRQIDLGVERAAARSLNRYEAKQDQLQAEADELERTREHLELFADLAALPSIHDDGEGSS